MWQIPTSPGWTSCFYVQWLDKCFEQSRQILEKFEESFNGSCSLYMKVLAELGSSIGANQSTIEDDADDNSESDLEDYKSTEDKEDEEDSEKLRGWFMKCWEKH